MILFVSKFNNLDYIEKGVSKGRLTMKIGKDQRLHPEEYNEKKFILGDFEFLALQFKV